jgi:hypothetical protein
VSSSRPWQRIDEVWTTSATAAGQGEVAFLAAAGSRLERLPPGVLGSLGPSSGPLFYIVRRSTSPTGFAPQVDLRIVPPNSGGFVAVKGLQRPAVMDGDTDTTGLGAEFDGAVVAWAKAACFDNEDDFDAAAQWRQRFDSELRLILEAGIDDDGPDVVDGMWAC